MTIFINLTNFELSISMIDWDNNSEVDAFFTQRVLCDFRGANGVIIALCLSKVIARSVNTDMLTWQKIILDCQSLLIKLVSFFHRSFKKLTVKQDVKELSLQ